ncbi:hypothetical protein FNV43_RR12437 [Rhamnella rubrinervis]|uniref:Uncharacterized protein n=1 Tax=Rhamnella rubrinervis TaxID=2594499 RepID=A0A8K0H7C7_9ROSA|nr:hypothetical protein FNV43_RR12437 [Rhamnella rubrinervis]
MDVETVLPRLPSRTIIPTHSKVARTTCRPTREAMVEKPADCNLVMGQVTKILKRGEELPETSLKHKKLINKEKNGVSDITGSMTIFACSFCSFASPAPSSLPIPSFLTNKKRITCSSKDEEALDLELLELGCFAV